MGIKLKFEVRKDSLAAKAIGLRLGAAKLRSLEIKTLLSAHLQEWLIIGKCVGQENPADLATKAWAKIVRDKLWKNIKRVLAHSTFGDSPKLVHVQNGLTSVILGHKQTEPTNDAR
eukprot:666953-Amphidinium_carterae.2